MRKAQDTITGEGELKFSGFIGPIQYELTGNAQNLQSLAPRLRGALKTTPEIATAAFKAGYGTLSLADGRQRRITVTAMTAGDATCFFEIAD
ncbi:hypothetical protein [Phenylobacterium sp.]|uniref:hypothetical protein n=1 Tax=Phenylobacterium sp. TaxID=1871053 RepID=UPI002732DC33|nr:hypothetical protein [Phenylobacterium sp.]MDP3658477.1 hypothetical protein [Phenylobacterium sp.]